MRKTVSVFIAIILFARCNICVHAIESNKQMQEIFVEQGAVDGDGSYRKPYGTFEEARDYIRELKESNEYPNGGVTVNFREGIYPVNKAISLGAEDSGTEEGPVIYRAFQNEKVEFTGGRYFDINNKQGVNNEYALSMLDESIVQNVKQIPISDLGLTLSDFGEIDLRGTGSEFLFTMGYDNRTPNAELYYGEESMSIARWPNLNHEDYGSSYVVTGDIVESGTDATITDINAATGMSFKADIPTEKLNKWNEQKSREDIWMHGFWFYDWSDSTTKLSTINVQEKTISTLQPSSYKVRKNQRFFVFNVLSELDAPGEWYLDKETENLYVYPKGDKEIFVSLYKGTILTAYELSNVIIEGFNFKGTRGTAVSVRKCDNVGFNNLNVSCCAESGVDIVSSNNSYLTNSQVYAIGGYATSISGGDYATLAKGNNYIDNCTIHDYSQRDMTNTPGIHIDGVGNTISHCEIYEAPHFAIKFFGNDNVIEYNNIHDVCKDADDAAAIYSYQSVVRRGNIIRHNYLHDLISYSTADSGVGIGIYGVYHDGGMSGNTIESNVFENINKSGGAVFLGARDHTIENNIVIDCYSVVRIAAAGLFEMINGKQYEGQKFGLTSDFYKNEPYTKYPHLANILEDEPFLIKYNMVRNNIDYRKNKFIGYSKDYVYTHVPGNKKMTDDLGVTAQSLFPNATEEELAVIQNNIENDNCYLGTEYINQRNSFYPSLRTYTDPGFTDNANNDYSLPQNSDIYTHFPDFKAPDFKNIGLRKGKDFGVESVSVTDQNGKKLLKLCKETDNVNITVKFKNDNAIQKDVNVFVKHYNEDGTINKIAAVKEKITDENREISILNFDGGSDKNSYIKVFVWDAEKKLSPIDISYLY